MKQPDRREGHPRGCLESRIVDLTRLTFLVDDILDVLIAAIEGTGVVGDNPAPKHPFSLWDRVTCHHTVIKSDYYYSLML